MCGIAGWMVQEPSELLRSAGTRMARALHHRGPDAGGVYVDEGIVLAHRRLSIVDLSDAGAQPMRSHSGSLVITYNGELYNIDELVAELPSCDWRGHSDTEVLLEALQHWGVEGALRRAHGMFAFALWDTRARTLTLARDRAGEKPLYYGSVGGGLAFASELKSLRVLPGWEGSLDRESVALFMQHSYVPAPRSIFQGIGKLPPGHWVTVKACERRRPPPSTPYWTLGDTIGRARQSPIHSLEDATNELDGLLRAAVHRQCRSDVPFGAFLSGGIDSSTIVALMQTQLREPVRTFTIGFTEPGYDESGYARAVAEHLGTRHTELIVTPNDSMAVIPEIPTIYDEPFADSSQIPTVLVSRLARAHVAVALSGDAGDELFGGYNRYLLTERIARASSKIPTSARRLLTATLLRVSPQRWQQVYDLFGGVLPSTLQNWPFGDRLHKLLHVLSAEGVEGIYRALIAHWSAPEICLAGSERMSLPAADDVLGLNRTEWMMRADFESYLPSDILVKVDRAAMSTSLETRVPLLDPRVIEFAWRLDFDCKVRGSAGKYVLRKVLERYVPRALFERPKTGFGIPLDSWLRGPLRAWAADLLTPASLRDHELLRPEVVRTRWAQHLSGQRNWQYHLWDVLMLQSWLREQKRPIPLATSSSRLAEAL